MQTFLPYEDFEKTAKCLDVKRLGKQRVETKQIYLALTRKKYGWKNSPAVMQWRRHIYYLCLYGEIVCTEWRRRGYRDRLLWEFRIRRWLYWPSHFFQKKPVWLGNEQYHQSHRAKLFEKNQMHYNQFFDDYLQLHYWNGEKEVVDYYWPSKEGMM